MPLHFHPHRSAGRVASHAAAAPALAVLAALAGALPIAAQSAAGSASQVALQPGACSGTAVSTDVTHRVEWGLVFGPREETSSSASYTWTSGALLDPGDLVEGPPLVLGVSSSLGTADGAFAVDVVGFGFTASGAGATSVSLGGTAAGAPSAVSNTSATVVLPPGANEHGNPLTVGATLTNDLGQHTAPSAFAYLPALIEGGPTSLSGGELRLDVVAEAGISTFLFYGQTIPGVALPVPSYAGALEVLSNLKLADSGPFADGVTSFTLPLPADPALAGLAFALQGVVVETLSPFVGGSFTNAATVLIQP